MRRMRLISLITALLLGGLAQASDHNAKRTLVVAYYDFPPLSYTNKQQQATGAAISLVRRLGEHAGYPLIFRQLPSARVYQGLLDGSIDIWPGALGKPELAGHVLPSRAMIGHTELNLYRRPGTLPPSLPDDLRNREIILIQGYTYWQTATALLGDPQLKVRPHTTSSHESALLMLFKERGDYLLDYSAPVNAARQALQLPELPYTTLFRLDLSIIFSRLAPGAEQIRDDFDQAYIALLAAGELQEELTAMGINADAPLPSPLPQAGSPANSASGTAP